MNVRRSKRERRARLRTPWALFAVCALSISASAHAAPKDAAAKADDAHAMNDLFMAAHFDEAKQVLTQALDACEGRCSKRVRARLHRDLGVVEVTGFNDADGATKEFGLARGLDPAIRLDPVVTTPQVQAAFDSATPSLPADENVTLEEDESAEKPKKHEHEDEEAAEAPEAECTSDSDCGGGRTCDNGHCIAKPAAPSAPSVWLAIGFTQDFLFVSGSNVCSKSSQLGNFTCLRSTGSQYHGTPLPGDNLSFSPALAGTRVTLASYVPLSTKISADLRLGYAFFGQGPQPDGGTSYFPFLIELGAQYWLAERAFSTDGVGVFLEVSGGAAEADGKGSVTTHEDTSVPPPPNQLDNCNFNPATGACAPQKLDVYQKAGTAFFGAGAGLFLPFGRRFGLLADLRLNGYFPTSGIGMSLGVQGAFGL